MDLPRDCFERSSVLFGLKNNGKFALVLLLLLRTKKKLEGIFGKHFFSCFNFSFIFVMGILKIKSYKNTD